MVSVCPGSFQALPEQTNRHHYGAWKILTVITQLTRGASTSGGGGRAGKNRARGASTGQGGARAGKDQAGGSSIGALCIRFALV